MKDQDWDIKSLSDTCSICGKQFDDQEAFCSYLTFGDEGYVRADFCGSCQESMPQEDVLSVWRGVFCVPPPPPEETLKEETAESLLRKLIKSPRESHGNTIYILAAMLERKRILVEKDLKTRDDGVLIRVYEHKKTGDVFLVPDPKLKLTELDHVQQEVVDMLSGTSPETNV